MKLAPLPDVAARLLQQHAASPRLVVHLTLVHDVALQLLKQLAGRFPTVNIDASAVAFGAAIHDIGKATIPKELSEPGKTHEPTGLALLIAAGVSPRLARFAVTHGQHPTTTDLTIEDLVVQAADTVWKGKRSDDLDTQLATTLAKASGKATWEAFDILDGVLTKLAEDAEERIEHQACFPTT